MAEQEGVAVTACSRPDSWNGLMGRGCCWGAGLHHYCGLGGSRSPGRGTGLGSRGSRGCSNAAVAVRDARVVGVVGVVGVAGVVGIVGVAGVVGAVDVVNAVDNGLMCKQSDSLVLVWSLMLELL